MRKSIIASEVTPRGVSPNTANSLAVTELARIEVTSEDPLFPAENVFTEGNADGWRASEPGEQTLHLIFDEAVDVGRISMVFEEPTASRTQEIAIRWRPRVGDWREIVRQQWNFSPTGSTTEVETWQVKLEALCELELKIKPEVGGGPAIASLRRWVLA